MSKEKINAAEKHFNEKCIEWQKKIRKLEEVNKLLHKKICDNCDEIEKLQMENEYLEQQNKVLMELIASIQPKRKIQYYDSGNQYHTYMAGRDRNPCGCGSNCYHLEYDGEKIYGVCNACGIDIYEIKDEYVKEKLDQGIWK